MTETFKKLLEIVRNKKEKLINRRNKIFDSSFPRRLLSRAEMRQLDDFLDVLDEIEINILKTEDELFYSGDQWDESEKKALKKLKQRNGDDQKAPTSLSKTTIEPNGTPRICE